MLSKSFQEEYGDRLLKNINAYIESENLQGCIENRPGKRKRGGSPNNSSVLSAEHTGALRARIQKLVTMWADEEQMAGNKVFYWNILTEDQTKEIATKVPTNLDELAECMVPKKFQEEYGDRLLKNINAYIKSENLQGFIENRPQKKQRKRDDRPTISGVLSAEHTGALLDRIQHPVTMWADEEQMAGNKVFYWNILNGEQTKEIAIKVPTNLEELAECKVPENFVEEYGDRLLKSINAYIESENLQGFIYSEDEESE
jgi:ribonuclease D